MIRPAILVNALCIALIVACGGFHSTKEKLDAAFLTPPESIQTAVYWYWISGNISKEGVVKDLLSMKEVGINRAFIGNIFLEGMPSGEAKVFSDEWWEILHVALKTATELDIEIGIFNSPGWSQSGGPWVNSENAMRYLAASDIRVSGPATLSLDLETPVEPFQDVRVIAYPAPANDALILDTGVTFSGDSTVTIDIQAEQAFTARSLSIRTLDVPLRAQAQLQARNENGEFVTVKEFEIDRSNPALHVGFVPYAPVVISFPAVMSSDFRLLIAPDEPGGWYTRDGDALPGIAGIVISSAPRVERYAEKTMAKMFPSPLPYWGEYQWPPQAEVDDESLVVDPSKVVDITDFMTPDGTLNWNVPDGDWVILRTGMTPTGTQNSPAAPEATGYEVDKMSKAHAEKHFYAHIGEVLSRIPEADRKRFKVVVQDSYETGGQNFTDGFLEEFAAEYGYDPLPYLPVYQGVVVQSQEASDRFLWDMRRLVANKVAYDYVGGLREVSHKHGLTTWLENFGHWGFPGEFLMYGGQSDEIGGEFWSEGELGDIENRAATSSGHIYGKTKIWAESNTAGGRAFARYPGVIKQRGDRFFAEGINATLLHVYITQPHDDKHPGVNAWFGTEFNRKNTWFSQIDVYIQYLKRVNCMLQQGLNVADVAYFIGEDTPKMTGVTDPALPVGYQFDFMNAEVIEEHMTVKDGLMTLPHGTQYKILVLPKLDTMRPEVLAKINQLVQDGAVVLGPSPTRSPSLQNQPEADQQVRAMAADLWGDVDGVAVTSRKYGKGLIINGMDMSEAFALIDNVPDCRLPDDSSIHYGHRTLGDQEIYFLSNQTEDTQVVTPEFRVVGMQPELWEATTGYRRELPAYEQRASVTAVPLKLEPFESVFVVFRKPAGAASATGVAANYPEAEQVLEVKAPWTVSFDPAQRGPEEAVVFEELTDWTASDDEGIKYYSGTAFYANTFTLENLPDHKKIVIDLGEFTAMAKVTVNGEYAGGLWTPPHQLDISDLVRDGKNELRIEVVNTWVNRIIGDMRLPEEDREIWMPANPYDAESPLQPSGLFGPVTIRKFSMKDTVVDELASKYRDGRPEAKFRMDATDHGIVLRYGDCPTGCDILGARDVWVFEDNGKYYMHYDGAGKDGWLSSLAVSTDLINWEKEGPILDFGAPGSNDSKGACYGVRVKGW